MVVVRIVKLNRERVNCTVGEKKSKRIKLVVVKKRSAVFDRAMLTLYENKIFPTLSYAVVQIHKNTSLPSDTRLWPK